MFVNIPAGKKLPTEFNVIIEIAAQQDPVKYEVDKQTGAIFVDRFMSTTMRYPANYGYIPQTLAEDGDPVDVLVITPFPLLPASVISSRAIGLLTMIDESGRDNKILALPTPKICPLYADIKSYEELPRLILDQIRHFFEHYKDLEPNKWVKLEAWENIQTAEKYILDCANRYQECE